jgi:shikimate dehydrogenase
MRKFGLIGFPLSHSFSQGYFNQKFTNEGIGDAEYKNYPIDSIDRFTELVKNNPDFAGLNVTIPYKEQVIPFLDELDSVAREVEAINTIRFEKDASGKTILKGYNTDVFGFSETIKRNLQNHHKKALILGTGGASKAVQWVLNSLGLHCEYISRNASNSVFKTYAELTTNDIADFTVIVNTTPLGMYPNVDAYPPIPYEGITGKHILYDLIYNPQETVFLAKGKNRGAITINGLEMLHLQAEKAWEIWNNK